MSTFPLFVLSLVVLAGLYWQERLRWLRLTDLIKKLQPYGALFFIFVAAFLLTRSVTAAVVLGIVIYAVLASRPKAKSKGRPSPKHPEGMSLMEAHKILGLRLGANEDDVHAAYRAQMKENHPDYGGSTDYAAKLNEAKTLIIRHLRKSV